MRNCRRQGSEQAPPQSSGSEDTPGTKAIREPSGGRLEKSISQEKRAEDEAQADIADGEFLGQFCGGNGQIHAIQISHRAKDKQPQDEEPADAGCRSRVHSKDPPMSPPRGATNWVSGFTKKTLPAFRKNET